MSVEGSQHSTSVHLKGIPPKATIPDVLSFFSGLGLQIDDSLVKFNFKERRGAGEVRNIFFLMRTMCQFSRHYSFCVSVIPLSVPPFSYFSRPQ